MFRAVLWTLHQRRYAALALTGLLVALACIGAGTFELHRFHEKRHDNALLRANAHAPAVPLTSALSIGTAPAAYAIRYRTVTATGTFVAGAQQYVANQSQDGRQGFWVLSPLRTPEGAVLVVRGFVAATPDGTRPVAVPVPPPGQVTVRGRLDTAQTGDDRFGLLGHGEVTAINPKQQAARLHVPVYDAFLTLVAHSPATSGLAPVPGPDLSNPTGGAVEWQLMSYVVQWYAFAVLALVLPFLVSRSEVREARKRWLGVDPDATEFDAPPVALPAGSGQALATRAAGTVARRGGPVSERWARAERLADRYGRSLGVPDERALAAPDRTPVVPGPRSSAEAPHRSEDAYHGSYNDYLWELALADGGVPDVFNRPADDPEDGERPVP